MLNESNVANKYITLTFFIICIYKYSYLYSYYHSNLNCFFYPSLHPYRIRRSAIILSLRFLHKVYLLNETSFNFQTHFVSNPSKENLKGCIINVLSPTKLLKNNPKYITPLPEFSVAHKALILFLSFHLFRVNEEKTVASD